MTEHVFSALSTHGSQPPESKAFIRTFVSEACGSSNFSTGTAIFAPGSELAKHTHPYGEAVTVLDGRLRVLVEDRSYLLERYDCIYIPKKVAHAAVGEGGAVETLVHWAAASARPSRQLHKTGISPERSMHELPESVRRFESRGTYELSSGACFYDLFARRYGSEGICGGYASFAPGASLPCHVHDFDESITIIGGEAHCLVEGRSYELSNCDTAYVPRGLPHRFLNLTDKAMAMIWVYAGNEPDRKIVDAELCGLPGGVTR